MTQPISWPWLSPAAFVNVVGKPTYTDAPVRVGPPDSRLLWHGRHIQLSLGRQSRRHRPPGCQVIRWYWREPMEPPGRYYGTRLH